MTVYLFGLEGALDTGTAKVELVSADGRHSEYFTLSLQAALELKERLRPDNQKDNRGYTWRDYWEAARVGVDL